MPAYQCDEAIELAVLRMADREANACLLHPRDAGPLESPDAIVHVRAEPCPWCGAADAGRWPASALTPIRAVRLLGTGEAAPTGRATLTALACESLTARSLLVIAVALERGGGPSSLAFRTRAAACASLVRGGLSLGDLIAAVDAGEAWADALTVRSFAVAGDGTAGVLPASSRRRPGPLAARPDDLATLRGLLEPHFLTPHVGGGPLDELNERYLRRRRERVEAAPCP